MKFEDFKPTNILQADLLRDIKRKYKGLVKEIVPTSNGLDITDLEGTTYSVYKRYGTNWVQYSRK